MKSWTQADIDRYNQKNPKKFATQKGSKHARAKAISKIVNSEKKSKFRNVKSVYQGITFDSKKEMNRWIELNQLQKEKKIWNLERQVVFPLFVNKSLICNYIADFVYDIKDRYVVEDVKGMKLPIYNIKKRLMKAILEITILES